MKFYINHQKNNHTFISFHGTGGDEHSLDTIIKNIDPQSNIIGLRGRINESGMNRFFKRLSLGILDEESLEKESHYAYQFIVNLLDTYKINIKDVTLIGYSNGANLIASLIYLYPQAFNKAILLHPMKPYQQIKIDQKILTQLFISSGKYDTMIPHNSTLALVQDFKENGAKVYFYEDESGHEITLKELTALKNWYNQ